MLAATFLLGVGEVLYDNCAQTLMPSLVRADQFEKANGRLWAAQEAANQFVGPPLGSLLLLPASPYRSSSTPGRSSCRQR